MSNCIKFSARASLVMTGLRIGQMNVWPTIQENVHIKQKVLSHTPLDKMKDAFINILAGGHGLVEVNTRVRVDAALSQAFGRDKCADQSTISDTFNACTVDNVVEMRTANRVIYQRYGRGYAHRYDQGWQLLDVDMSGLPAGRQGEGVEKGYFAQQKNKRGRQLGRVVATLYDEIVVERLYNGKTQLDRSLQQLVSDAEQVLNLNPGFRKRTIMRVDAGGGRDEDINHLLNQEYYLLGKVKNWRRAEKLCRSVTTWYPDPKIPHRQMGWVEEPHAYVRPTRQLAIRHRKKNGKWSYHVLVFNLTDEMLYWLIDQTLPDAPLPEAILLTAMYAYDRRGGAAETSIKGSKQGLGITKRNKQRFAAQEMLILLGQLAYNLISWIRQDLATVRPAWQRLGMLRMVRDVFHISGQVVLDGQGHIQCITLNNAHPLAQPFMAGLLCYLARDGTSLNLGEI